MKNLMEPSRPMLLSHILAIACMYLQESLKVHARLTLHGFRLMTKSVTLNLGAGLIAAGRYCSTKITKKRGGRNQADLECPFIRRGFSGSNKIRGQRFA